jgi:RNA polymerase sigma-70 factor, ECF subfamily
MELDTDEVLIQESNRGNVASFKQLVQRHEGKVAGVVKSMLGSTPEAEDVGQEVFIKFYETLKEARAHDDMIDLKELLAYEMDRLEPDFKAVVSLRLVEGYTTEETSELLRIPLGTVLSRLSRAQIKLRLALTKKLKP